MTKLTQTKYRFGILVEFTHNMAGQTEFENSTGNTIYNATKSYFTTNCNGEANDEQFQIHFFRRVKIEILKNLLCF